MDSQPHAAEASGWYHDLRTATGQVLAYADLLGTSKLSREQSLDGIRASCSLLLELLDGLYDEVLSSVAADSSTKFEDLVATVVDTFRATADVRTVRLTVQQSPALPDVSFRTNVVLKRVLANLVSNALRHTQRGEVLVSAGFEPAAEESAQPRFHRSERQWSRDGSRDGAEVHAAELFGVVRHPAGSRASHHAHAGGIARRAADDQKFDRIGDDCPRGFSARSAHRRGIQQFWFRILNRTRSTVSGEIVAAGADCR